MKVIRHTRKSQKVDSEIGCKELELFLKPAFSVIEILARTLIEPHEVARADRFSDEMDVSPFIGLELRRPMNDKKTTEKRPPKNLHTFSVARGTYYLTLKAIEMFVDCITLCTHYLGRR